jgi:hypothetical protein
MKTLLSLSLLAVAVAGGAFDCYPFGPDIQTVYKANFGPDFTAIAGLNDVNNTTLYLYDGEDWDAYPFWATSFPVTGICPYDANTVMVAMGFGSYSDGVYNLNLTTGAYTINEWFIRPNFVLRCPANGLYYVGEQEGLFRSADASYWTRIATLGSFPCTSFTSHGDHLVANCGDGVWYSGDAGLTWQQSSMILLRGFRFCDDGTLYAYMAAESDSDGLWRSHDYGETWEVVFYTGNLSAIGPDFNGYLPLGWSQPNEHGCHLELLQPGDQLSQLSHPDLNSPVRQLDLMDLVNTPSFYVVNANGFFFVTNFINVDNDDEAVPPAHQLEVTVSPNPACFLLGLGFEDRSLARADLALYDLKGRRILCERDVPVCAGRLEYPLPALPSGLYLLRLDSGSRSRVLKLAILQ